MTYRDITAIEADDREHAEKMITHHMSRGYRQLYRSDWGNGSGCIDLESADGKDLIWIAWP